MKNINFKSGTGPVTRHTVDTAVDLGPGASLARHTYPSAALPTLAATAALTSWRPARAPRATAAGNFPAGRVPSGPQPNR
jgi:hypothetical protein